jgi:hypothetical protein
MEKLTSCPAMTERGNKVSTVLLAASVADGITVWTNGKDAIEAACNRTSSSYDPLMVIVYATA